MARKLYRNITTGSYYFEDENGDTISIYKISPKMYGWCINRGMTKGTFKTLKEAKEHFGLC